MAAPVVHLHDPQRQASDAFAAVMQAYIEDVASRLPRPDPDPLPKGLYSIAEAAEWLSVSESQVRQWVHDGWLSLVSPPDGARRRAIRREELVAFRDKWQES